MQFESAAAGNLAEAIRRVARAAHSEEDVRIGVERELSAVLQVLGLSTTAEYEKTTFSGAADAVYGHVTIEYKRPGRLAEKGFPAKLAEQLGRYLTDHARRAGGKAKQIEALEKMIGVGVDGEQILFLRYSATGRKRESPLAALPGSQLSFLDLAGLAGGFQMVGPVPVGRESIEMLLLYLRSLSRKPLTPEALAADLGPQGEIAPRLVNLLYAAIQTHRDHPRVSTLFAEWDRIFGIVYGEELGQAQKDAPELAALYRAVEGAKLKPLFFAVHTYYALLMKLLAVELASLQGGALVASAVAALPAATEAHLRRELTTLENGGTFALLGINNFLEGDFFGWYLDAWSEELADGIRALARTLAEFEPATTTLEPEHTRDLLKKLYQYLVPRKLRHDLGEYYTPDWLAERLLNQVGYNGDPGKRLIDPGSGSGTFLILALRRLRQYAADHLVPPAEMLDAALKNIVGFDLNPLSVIAARTNYLLALGDLLRYRRGPVDLPVYLCDSILAPTERADLFGKSYRLHTVVGDFDIPGETVAAGEMGPLSALLEGCVRDGYTPDEFLARSQRALAMSQPMTRTVLEALYRRLLDLQQEGRNGLWARLIKNAFAPVLVGKFDFVVGNPPWVNWESLSAEYREATKGVWERYAMQARADGGQFALGKVKRDLSMLFAFVCIDKYLSPQGRLGFVITQTVFKTKSGEVFRAFQVGPDTPFRVTHVDDMVALQPFEGASNWTAVFVCEKGKLTHYPVPYTLWWPLPKHSITLEDTLEEVTAKTKRVNFSAKPVQDDQPTSPWITAYPGALKALTNAIGKSDYTARAGVVTWADGIYWVQVLHVRPDGKLIIANLNKEGKRKIQAVQAAVESDLLYPFARWTDISRWKAAPSCYIVLPHTPESGWRAIEESVMKTQHPLTYSYLKRFESILLRRSGYVQLRQGQPFYILSNTGNWLYAPWKVGWKRMGTTMEAAVLSEVNDRFVGKKPLIYKETVVYIACESEQEAHYLCAMLNSTIVNFIAKAYSVGKSFGSPHLLQQVRIPHFDPANPLHCRLAAFSRQAHELAGAGDQEVLTAVEDQVDKAAAELWGLSNGELREIRRSLVELG